MAARRRLYSMAVRVGSLFGSPCCGGVFSVLEHSLDRDALRLDCPSEPLWFPRQACVVDTWTQADDLSGDLQRVSLDGSGDWY